MKKAEQPQDEAKSRRKFLKTAGRTAIAAPAAATLLAAASKPGRAMPPYPEK